MRRSYLSIAFYMLVVFASGIVVGTFGHIYTVKAGKLEPIGRPLSPDEWRKTYVKDLKSRLTLDGDQVKKLDEVLDHTRDKIKAVKTKYRPEMKNIHDEQIQSVRAFLNPSQQAEYDKYRAEKQKKLEQQERISGSRP